MGDVFDKAEKCGVTDVKAVRALNSGFIKPDGRDTVGGMNDLGVSSKQAKCFYEGGSVDDGWSLSKLVGKVKEAFGGAAPGDEPGIIAKTRNDITAGREKVVMDTANGEGPAVAAPVIPGRTDRQLQGMAMK